ncbi:hypothetical protein BDV95DRAFT_571042 [Massariosphaeria phaeospora]|uniref:RING-CH-type domain-containing protein n=1 Tax=Massariosphaeria phaeospora TaxID=100035 RepID=A0A7C8IA69_9PLEO|nr:hypothetical protein BDV95DRAFT_571042 [Massariosphaeria phaeospora]
MASLPPQRPAAFPRPSPSAADSSPAQEQPARTSSFSATSVDSETLLLDSPSSQTSHPAQAADKAPPTQQEEPQGELQEDAEPRKCWICFTDETEDDETTSEWRSPCPCVLVAHEKCLLDWIADMEAPTARRRAGGKPGKILCPQCKSEIRLERPQSIVVDTVRSAERWVDSALVPGCIFAIATATYTTFSLAGTHTIYEIFGTEDALQILRPLYQPPNAKGSTVALWLIDHLRRNWRLDLGLPLIPFTLIMSRTTLVDPFLPFLPLPFVAGSGQAHDQFLQFSWPPSAAFTIALLPYIRGIYNGYYKRVWAPREKRWLKQIQPRAGADDADDRDPQIPIEDENEVQEEEGHDDDDDDDNNVEEIDRIEVAFDLDIFANWNNGGVADNQAALENPPVPIARGPAHPLDAPPVDDDDDHEDDHDDHEPPPLVDAQGPEHNHDHDHEDGAAPAPNVPRQPARPRRRRVRPEDGIGWSSSSLSDTIFGALIFPSIAAAVGEALRHALPKSWVTLPAYGKQTGFLQARWGRSILGGCLFVGVKDAVLLYVRWKMAQNHRKRTVLDYEHSKGKQKKGAGRV